jgi:hypothetical protein
MYKSIILIPIIIFNFITINSIIIILLDLFTF